VQTCVCVCVCAYTYIHTYEEMTVVSGITSGVGSKITSSVDENAPGWLGGDVMGYVDEVLGGFFQRADAVNKFALAAGDIYGNQIAVGGSASVVTATFTSEEVAHTASWDVTDLDNGFYGLSYQTTRSGWYVVRVSMNNEITVDGAFRVYVSAGVGENTQTFACHHEGTGCYNR
jgi:hypothetical protein